MRKAQKTIYYLPLRTASTLIICVRDVDTGENLDNILGLPKVFDVSQQPSDVATCWNYKNSLQCVKNWTGGHNKNQNKIFHSHRDKRHKFPLRIDSFARDRRYKKKTWTLMRGCLLCPSFSGALAAQGDYVWQPTWDNCLDIYGTWVLSAQLELELKLELDVPKIGLSIVIYWLCSNLTTTPSYLIIDSLI